jgi:hypothetical protein
MTLMCNLQTIHFTENFSWIWLHRTDQAIFTSYQMLRQIRFILIILLFCMIKELQLPCFNGMLIAGLWSQTESKCSAFWSVFGKNDWSWQVVSWSSMGCCTWTAPPVSVVISRWCSTPIRGSSWHLLTIRHPFMDLVLYMKHHSDRDGAHFVMTGVWQWLLWETSTSSPSVPQEGQSSENGELGGRETRQKDSRSCWKPGCRVAVCTLLILDWVSS